MFDTMRDANLYLHGSYVKCKGEAVLVNGVNSDGVVSIATARGEESVLIEDIDLSPFYLGYKKVGDRPEYIQRVPARQWRQGLTHSSISVLGGGTSVRTILNLQGNVIQQLMNSDYPSLSKAYNDSKDLNKTVAFHSKYLIDRLGIIHLKNKPVGSYNGRNITLLSPFTFLRNEIEEISYES